MCPSSRIPCAVENEHWTDEEIFMSLFNFKIGKPLPLNVTSDVNPFQYKPSDLSADLWYLCSGVNKDAECGFWLETEVARHIFSNSVILGYRTSSQFYEGRAPHGEKTDWVMQEYTITDKCDTNEKDHRALCRVFLANEKRPLSGKCIANINVKISINVEPETVSNVNNRGRISTSELLENSQNAMDSDTWSSLVERRSPKPFLENTFEPDSVLTGDYFELNDFIDSGSRSSTSTNSSCLTMTSEEYFDSVALLQELDDAIADQEIKDLSVKFNISAPIESKQVSTRPATSVSMRIDQECKHFSLETYKAENRNKSTSNDVNTTTTSSSSSEGTSKDGTGEHIHRMKRRKMIKYLCFFAF